jgi:hypothetical protein
VGMPYGTVDAAVGNTGTGEAQGWAPRKPPRFDLNRQVILDGSVARLTTVWTQRCVTSDLTMNKVISILALTLALAVSAFGQQINYRLGAIFGRSELYGVVGTDLFPVFPKWKINAEAVTFTPLGGVSTESPIFGGAGLVRRWMQPEGHAFEAGASAVTEVGNGWSRIDQISFAISGGVRF